MTNAKIISRLMAVPTYSCAELNEAVRCGRAVSLRNGRKDDGFILVSASTRAAIIKALAA